MPARPITASEKAAVNRKAFRALLDGYGLTQKEGAELIQLQTGRPCSYRTIKAWMANEVVQTYRPCPTWAVDALTCAVQSPTLLNGVRAVEPA